MTLLSKTALPQNALAKPIDRTLLEESVLPYVFKPARYLGLEQGAFRKPFHQAEVTMAVAFPDLYEIGFSNYGLKLLYSLVNQQPQYLCDRVYAPATDFRDRLKEFEMPLFGVESFMPLQQFDVLAFSLQYELNYTTILGILDSANIPFRSKNRGSTMPLLIAGGPGSANPMPLAPFFDVFIIGDGEDVLLEMLAMINQFKKQFRKQPQSRDTLLNQLAKLEGVFIPGKTAKAYKRIVDIAEKPVEMAPLIPIVGAVHDRITVEARRGCDRMCRFCQPCFINLPVREQSIENIKAAALREVEKTGYDECSLLSLSIADYSYFKPLILEVAESLKDENVSLSLPSQRADRFSLDVAEAVQSIRKSSLTFAPEAGTTRLRDVINKNLTDAEILSAVTTAYRAGWNKVKLYFMIGLPTETHADLDGIIDMVSRMQEACRLIKREPGLSIKKSLEINITLSNFVPKPHTPFQWVPQDTMEQLYHKITYLKDKAKGLPGIKLNFTDPEISKLEAVISRAGEELSDVIELAWQKGAYLDAWDDSINFDRWFAALEEQGIEYEAYTRDRCCDLNDSLPWDCVDVGLTKAWLQEEYRKATQASSTTPCFEECSVCGVCGSYSTWPKFIETPAYKTVKAMQPDPLATPGVIPVKSRHPVVKVRLKLEKKGDLKFISHLDWLRSIHRAVSRSKIPVAYSQGFNPKPKISFSPALPLFMESTSEFVDIELLENISNLKEILNVYLPENGRIVNEMILPLSAPSIDKSIEKISYEAKSIIDTTCTDPDSQGKIVERINFIRQQATLPVIVDIAVKSSQTRRQNQCATQKVLDLAPYLDHLSVRQDSTVLFTFGQPTSQYQKRLENLEVSPEDHSENRNGLMVCSGSMNENAQKAIEQVLVSETGLPVFEFGDRGVISIKPSWLLGLIHPTSKWLLTKSAVILTPSAF
jgi:radical SAM-linked protein